jgi:hypothetical protein
MNDTHATMFFPVYILNFLKQLYTHHQQPTDTHTTITISNIISHTTYSTPTKIAPSKNAAAMDSTAHKSHGFTATQPSSVQVANTIATLNQLGSNIRNWSRTARKELTYGDVVDVVNIKGNIIGLAPKAALIVMSQAFRAHFEAAPGSAQIKVTDANVEDKAVFFLLNWIIKTINAGSFRPNEHVSVPIPGSNGDLIKLRYAAHKLGMQQYVAHFPGTYKYHLRDRVPAVEECVLLDRLALGTDDELVMAVGGRMAYLRRTGAFNPSQIATLAAFLGTHANIGQAVEAADCRSAGRRYQN